MKKDVCLDGRSLIASSTDKKSLIDLLKSVEGYGSDVFTHMVFKTIGDSNIFNIEYGENGSIYSIEETYINYDSNSGCTVIHCHFDPEELYKGEEIPTDYNEIVAEGYDSGIRTEYWSDIVDMDRTNIDEDELPVLYEFMEALSEE